MSVVDMDAMIEDETLAAVGIDPTTLTMTKSGRCRLVAASDRKAIGG